MSDANDTMNSAGGLVPAGSGPLPTPPRLNLGTVDAVRREMARVYRHAKFGQMATQDATRLIYMLSQILKAFELTEIEKRIAALEDTQE